LQWVMVEIVRDYQRLRYADDTRNNVV